MKKDQEYFKKQLLDERKVVISELASIGVIKDTRSPDDWQTRPVEDDTMRSDPNEVGDRIETYEKNDALVNQLEQRLREIDIALDKIKNNTFGTCEIDGEEIESDRLEANPAARTCKKHMSSKLN